MAIIKNTYNPASTVSIKAVADITGNRFVSFTGNIPSTDTKSLGVAESKAASSETFSVITLGTAIVETAVAINVGDNVTTDATGRAKIATGAIPVNGRAITSCSGAGFITIQLVP